MQPITNVKDATIVITGASSGFGRGVALKLAELGAHVVLAARRTAALEELQHTIETNGGSALAVTTDVSDAEAVQRLADAAIERFGSIDVWINNTGIGALGLFWDIPLKDYDRVIDVNLKGVVYGAHVAIRHFQQQGQGTLVNVGSIDSEVPLAYQTVYASTKSAVLSISRSLNAELRLAGYDKIKVGTIMPWAVDTPWWTHAANYTGHAPRMAAMDDPQIVIDAIVDACTNPKEEQPVGWKARSSNVSHRIFANFSEFMTAKVAQKSVQKAMHAEPNCGAIYEPMETTICIDGGIRQRMKEEDDASS
ncbi:oxidoreductase [Aliidiomarina sedimenti]|uniref:Oxidoreductase n=1 Tax=Aliidiomarina sedimenti TaxID=1933879 RepID=A0ABY0C077_9GAMM|nr:SDR family NAD(P)-dependent oxidoreductase [Aliidiomarina sedimenti]RUO30788.1 oxidoreductase [Aliidiomarina sedimenti]